MNEDKLPYISKELIQFMEKFYPDKCPEPYETDREIWINCGAVGVLRHLRRIYEDQHEKELGD